jgi:hypothetical protein
MITDLNAAAKKGDGTGVLDAGKLPDQKEIIAKQQ